MRFLRKHSVLVAQTGKFVVQKSDNGCLLQELLGFATPIYPNASLAYRSTQPTSIVECMVKITIIRRGYKPRLQFGWETEPTGPGSDKYKKKRWTGYPPLFGRLVRRLSSSLNNRVVAYCNAFSSPHVVVSLPTTETLPRRCVVFKVTTSPSRDTS